ncbi:alpha/beta hydrolase [Niabella aquatica]
MASVQSRLFTALLRVVNKKDFLKRQLQSGKTSFLDCSEPSAFAKKRLHIEKLEASGHNVFMLSHPAAKNGIHIIYLHGGAYVQGFTKLHWSFITQMIESTHCTVIAPDYPLAPKYTYKATSELVISVYKQVIANTDPANVILMGDSSGGGLALAVAQQLKKDNISQPAQIILLSPWLDITLSNKEIEELDSRDPFLGIKGLLMAGRAYAGDTDPHHFLLSPIYGSLEGLGIISVFAGTNEMLVADTRKLKLIADARGIPFRYFEYPEMIHAWMLFDFPESRTARKQIFELIKDPVFRSGL